MPVVGAILCITSGLKGVDVRWFSTHWKRCIMTMSSGGGRYRTRTKKTPGEVPMRAHAKALVAAVFAALCLFASVAAAAEVEVLWLGHSTTRITSATGKVIVIDPFLTNNPKTPTQYKDLKALGKVDLILVTHQVA